MKLKNNSLGNLRKQIHKIPIKLISKQSLYKLLKKEKITVKQ